MLATIHESHDYIPPKPTVILQLHRDLYKYSGKSIGGSFKNSDNVIAEELPDGRKIVGLSLSPRGKRRERWSHFATLSRRPRRTPSLTRCC